MTGPGFDESDVAGLQARLEGLDLPPGERAALDRLIALAGEGSAEVAGFASPGTPRLGDVMGFLSSGHTTGSNATARRSPGDPTRGVPGPGDGVVASGGGNDI